MIEKTMTELEQLAREPLDAELAACVCDGPLGPMIAHKYVHTITAIPGLANRQLKYARERANNAWVAGDWESYVFAHERPYRTEALAEALSHTSDSEMATFGAVARQVWTDSENIHQNLEFWHDVFAETECYGWMTDDELQAFNRLPDVLTVYRGECNDGGWSWTLDYDVARFFACRGVNESTGEVTTARVRKRDVMAYLTSRAEEEILVRDRDAVFDDSTVAL